MTFQAKITLDVNEVIGEVHDHLYGANLEHIGQTVYGGHWAEMLKDRKFAGHDSMYTTMSEGLSTENPAYGIVIPWEAVNPDHDHVLFVHDNTTFYTGKQSQRISVFDPDGISHGIQQAGLYLEANFSYVFRIVLRGEGQAVEVQLGDQTWMISDVKDGWQTYHHTFTPTHTEPSGNLSITIQSGNLWVGCASLMPADHIGGHRPDVVAAIKEWTPTFLRWPGGNVVSAYHWLDGVGDRDKRPSYLDPAWNLWESNDVGTDEFVELCRFIGSEPVLTANMGNGTPEEAAAWVEYCNGDASTKYGAMRAANGNTEPYNIKTWFVGNEQFGNWQVGHSDAETYAHNYLKFTQAMKAVDPELLVIAVGVPVNLYGRWNELVLKMIADQMDELSVHYYSIRTEKWDEPPPSEELYLPKIAAAHEVAQMLDQTWEVITQYSDPPVPIAFDEWNTYFGAKPAAFYEDYNIADALYAGALMNACIQRCDRIKLTAIYNLINVMGNYRVTPEFTWGKIPTTRGNYWVATQDEHVTPPMVWKTPTTLVMELLTHHRGEAGISCSVASPTMQTPAAGNLPSYDDLPVIDAAATYNRNNHLAYLSIVNRHPYDDVEIDIRGFVLNNPTDVYLVVGDSPNAMNTASEPQAVMIQHITWQSDAQPLRLPAHCFAMVVLR